MEFGECLDKLEQSFSTLAWAGFKGVLDNMHRADFEDSLTCQTFPRKGGLRSVYANLMKADLDGLLQYLFLFLSLSWRTWKSVSHLHLMPR